MDLNKKIKMEIKLKKIWTIIYNVYKLFVFGLWILFIYIFFSLVYWYFVTKVAITQYIEYLNKKTIKEFSENFFKLYKFFDLRDEINKKKRDLYSNKIDKQKIQIEKNELKKDKDIFWKNNTWELKHRENDNQLINEIDNVNYQIDSMFK